MATAILRPSADGYNGIGNVISFIGGPYLCSTGSTGYNLINEVSADDDSTYIYWEGSVTALALGTTPRLAYFQLDTSSLPARAEIDSATIHYRAKGLNSGTKTLAVALAYGTVPTTQVSLVYGSAQTVSNNSYVNYSLQTSPQYASSTIDTGEELLGIDEGLYVAFDAVAYKSASKDTTVSTRLTQVYVEIEYHLRATEPSITDATITPNPVDIGNTVLISVGVTEV